ncbi:MAG: hypothetical protein IPI61_15150 [Syntrophaceae bacterium]|nr:hypothetical protein [Syntrophaceae bacterium]
MTKMGIRGRIFNKELLSRITTAEEAFKHIRDRMTVSTSGVHPLQVPQGGALAVAERVRKGEPLRLSLLTGASVGVELDETWADVNCIAKRFPYQTGKKINQRLNAGDTMFFDIHLVDRLEFAGPDAGLLADALVAVQRRPALFPPGDGLHRTDFRTDAAALARPPHRPRSG